MVILNHDIKIYAISNNLLHVYSKYKLEVWIKLIGLSDEHG